MAQPKAPPSAQVQFNELLSAFNISPTLSWADKLAQLRSVPGDKLLSTATNLKINQFRPTTDSLFIQPTIFQSLDNGNFGRRIAARNIRIMLGECRDEGALYASWYPPQNDRSSLYKRLLADYTAPIVDTLMKLYCPDGKLPSGCQDWNSDAFGLSLIHI